MALVILGGLLLTLTGCGVPGFSSGVEARPPLRFGPTLLRRGPARTFLLATGSDSDTAVILVSARSGRVVDPDVASGGFVGAVEDRAGAILVGTSPARCPTDLYLLRPGRPAHLLRRISVSVASMALSPNGRRLAFLTYDSCVVPGPAAAQVGPTRLAILDLETGRITRTPDSAPFAADPAWSPDGNDVIVDGGFHLTILPADDLAHREPIPGPADCTESGATWTTAGIWATVGCGPNRAAQSTPSELVHITPAGHILDAWRLPHCAAAAWTIPVRGSDEPLGLISMGDIGVGRCSPPAPVRIVRLQAGLPTLATFPSSTSTAA